ncbi:MAG: dihydrofolate reductase [Pseudomonadota bacterium]
MTTKRDARLSMIVAIAKNGAIGKDGTLPWRLSSDLKLFRRLTMGKPLIMGRRTFESLPGALDGRDNIVISRNKDYVAEGAEVCSRVSEAIFRAHACAKARGVDEIMVIGGAAIYDAFTNYVDRLYLTTVDASPEADTFLHPLDDGDWALVSDEPIEQGPRDDYRAHFAIYDRKTSED